MKDVGEKDGKYYSINVPLKDGIEDSSFTRLFKTVCYPPMPFAVLRVAVFM